MFPPPSPAFDGGQRWVFAWIPAVVVVGTAEVLRLPLSLYLQTRRWVSVWIPAVVGCLVFPHLSLSSNPTQQSKGGVLGLPPSLSLKTQHSEADSDFFVFWVQNTAEYSRSKNTADTPDPYRIYRGIKSLMHTCVQVCGGGAGRGGAGPLKL